MDQVRASLPPPSPLLSNFLMVSLRFNGRLRRTLQRKEQRRRRRSATPCRRDKRGLLRMLDERLHNSYAPIPTLTLALEHTLLLATTPCYERKTSAMAEMDHCIGFHV